MRRAIAGRLNWALIAGAGLAAGGAISLQGQLPSPLWLLPLPLLAWAWPRMRLSLLLATGLCAWIGLNHAWMLDQRLPLAAHGEIFSVEGRIVGVPEQGPQVTRFEFASADRGRLRLGWYRDAPALAPGQCWQLRARLRLPRGSVNPGGLDYEAWLFRRRIAATGSVLSGEPCGPAGGLDHWRAQHQQRLEQAIGSAQAAATVSALALGLRDGLTDRHWDILRRTGTSHLFAISGLHLGLIAAFGFGLGAGLWRLGGYRRCGRAAAWGAFGGAALAVAYAAIAGFGVPVQRALVMCLVALLAVALGRHRDPFAVLALAAVAVLAIDPLMISAPGFWLSFTAVAAILCWVALTPPRPWWRRLLEIQLLLGLLLMPLTLLFFGGASLVALPVNLLLVPLFSLLLPPLLLAALWPQSVLGGGLLAGIAGLLDGLWALLDSAAGLEHAYVMTAQPGLAATVLAMVGLVGWLLPAAAGLRLPATLCLLPALLASAPRPAPGEFRLDVWDVGQGQSVLVTTVNHSLLYDTGPAWPGGFDAGRMLVAPALRARGIARLDTLLVSHGDLDHAGGVDGLTARIAAARTLGHGGEPCRAGQHWQWDGVDFQILHPAGGDWRDDNNASCVLRIRGQHGAALIPGDIEAAAERGLLARGIDLRSDVLLVPHHGSSSSSTPDFVAAVAPRLALVSAGYANRWDFPRPEVRRRYTDQGAALAVTGWSGALSVEVGENLRLRHAREARRRIWRYPAGPPAAAGR